MMLCTIMINIIIVDVIIITTTTTTTTVTLIHQHRLRGVIDVAVQPNHHLHLTKRHLAPFPFGLSCTSIAFMIR